MRAVLFDLDDTLYPEAEYVRSGFRAVARHLARAHGLDEEELFRRQVEHLEAEGRGRIFDRLLESEGLWSAERVRALVLVYRSHRPQLSLYGDALPVLDRLAQRGHRLGLVTDGMASMQWSKIRALSLESRFDAIVCCDEIGSDCWKPSAIPFQVALEILGVAPGEAAYVGNDPAKDFESPNALGMLTVHVDRSGPGGAPADDAVPRAAHLVGSLGEALEILER